MEALRIKSLPSPGFVCSRSSPPSSSFRPSLRTQLACRPSPRLHASSRFSSIVAAASPHDAEAKKVASEKAVEGDSEQVHETARKLSHAGVKEAENLEIEADAESEEVSAQASAEPKSSGGVENVGSGHEEGLKAAEKMTPKAN